MSSTVNLNKSDLSNKGLLARYPLIFFFIIAYAGSWLVVLPYLRFNGTGLLPFSWPIPFFVSATIAPFAGPFLAGIIMSGVLEGWAGIRSLFSRIVLWRVGLSWYLFVLVGIPAIMVLGAIAIPGVLDTFQMPKLSFLLAYPIVFIITLFIGGPLGEEPGWRGFALPRLQKLHGPLLGSLVLGVFWAFWHLPFFWMPEWGTPKDSFLDIVYFVLADIALTFIYTWVFNNTKSSLFIVILMHASNDAFFINELFVTPVIANSLLSLVISFGVFALLLIVITKGRLGYEHEVVMEKK